jgi:hypothetical protein
VNVALADESYTLRILAELAQLCIERGYDHDLMPFYLLHYAWSDLETGDQQWYWQGATRSNIWGIIRTQFETFAQRNSGNA